MQMESLEELELVMAWRLGKITGNRSFQQERVRHKSFCVQSSGICTEHYSDRNITIESICKELGGGVLLIFLQFSRRKQKTFIKPTDYRMEKLGLWNCL